MNFLSLFAGIGGFDGGFETAGMECIGQCEIDKWANMVLRYHYPNVQRIDDVKKLNRSTLDVRPDLICGGVPCQDLSIAGKRAGLAGRRSGLYFEFERIVAEFKPAWFVIENVPGLLSSNEKRDFATIIRRMGERGYLQAWRVLDSQYFGVAQRRRRVFVVGSLGSGRCAQVLFERESLPGNPAESRAKGQGFAADVAPRLESSGRGVERAGETRGQDPVIAVAEPVMKQQNYIAQAFTERTRKDGRNLETQDELAYALTNPGSGGKPHSRCIHGPFGVRRLTPRECERLQGFEDDYTRYGIDEKGNKVEISDSQRYKMLGNAVTKTVAAWIGKRIKKTGG